MKTRLDEFDIEAVLAQSSTGIVYRASVHVLKLHMAIKQYLPDALALLSAETLLVLRARTPTVDSALGPWTDLYAPAATLHLCICGQLPPPPAAAGTASRFEPLPTVWQRLRAAQPGLGEAPPWLEALDAGLSEDAARRPQSLAEMRKRARWCGRAGGHGRTVRATPRSGATGARHHGRAGTGASARADVVAGGLGGSPSARSTRIRHIRRVCCVRCVRRAQCTCCTRCLHGERRGHRPSCRRVRDVGHAAGGAQLRQARGADPVNASAGPGCRI
jgi:hypothetical protein